MRVGEFALVVAGFAGLTILLSWPQVLLLTTAIGPHYDALFSVWRVSWIAHALVHQPAHLFDANIFYPERATLAYSDAVLLPGVLGAPALWTGADRIAVYNVLVLASFVGCGTAMYALVRHLTGSRLAGWFAGVVFAFQPYRFAHYAHMELLWSWPIPVALAALDRVICRRRVRDGVLLGVAVALQAWSCVYYLVFLATALAIVGAVMLIGRRLRDLAAIAKPALIAVAIAAVLIAPYAAIYAGATRTVGLRDIAEFESWSPSVGSYLATPAWNRLYGGNPNVDIERVLFPGSLAILLAIVGLVPPLDRRRLAYLATALLAFDISLGAHGLTGAWVFQHVPLYRGLRVPARMAVIVSAAIAVLAGHGIALLVGDTASWRRWMAVSLVAGVVAESASMPLPLLAVDRTMPHVSMYLRQQPTTPIVDWPLPAPSSLGVTAVPWYMYESTYHWQPLVEGYSGFYPESYIRLLNAMDDFPSRDAIDYLRRDGVGYVVLHSRPDERAYVAMRSAVSATGAFDLILDEHVEAGEVALYRLKPTK